MFRHGGKQVVRLHRLNFCQMKVRDFLKCWTINPSYKGRRVKAGGDWYKWKEGRSWEKTGCPEKASLSKLVGKVTSCRKVYDAWIHDFEVCNGLQRGFQTYLDPWIWRILFRFIFSSFLSFLKGFYSLFSPATYFPHMAPYGKMAIGSCELTSWHLMIL